MKNNESRNLIIAPFIKCRGIKEERTREDNLGIEAVPVKEFFINNNRIASQCSLMYFSTG
jgi:hypothetical protein